MANHLVRSGILLYFCLGPVLAVMAQNGKQTTSSGSQQETQTPSDDQETLALPAPLGGFVPRLTSGTESTINRPSILTGSIGGNALYTNNAFSSAARSIDGYLYSVLPSIGFQTFGQRTQWTLNYAGGITLQQGTLHNTQQSHDAVADLRHDFTRRLAVEVREDYTFTNDPFAEIGASDLLPTVTGPGQISPIPVSSFVTRTGSVSTASLMYQLSQHSGMGFSGSYSLLRFQDETPLVGTTGSLIDTTNTAGRGFYLRQISPHQTIGAEYQLQNLSFNTGLARTVDQTVYLFDGISFAGNMSLTFYAGPEISHTHNAIVAQPNRPPLLVPLLADVWSGAGGVAYAFRGKRNGVRISADRGVSDGGGWTGAVRLNTASVELERALGPRWTARLAASYSDGRTIGLTERQRDAGRITTEQGLIGFLWQLTQQMSARWQYARVQQPHSGLFTQTLDPDHNEIQVGLVYQFQKGVANERPGTR